MITNKKHETALAFERMSTSHERMYKESYRLEASNLNRELTASRQREKRAIEAGEELRKQVEKAEAEKAAAVAHRDAMEARYRALTIADGNVAQAKKVHAWLTEPEPTPAPEPTPEVETTTFTHCGVEITVPKADYDRMIANAVRESIYRGVRYPLPFNYHFNFNV